MNHPSNPSDENGNALPELSDQELDRVLAGVAWPEVTEDELDRHEAELRSLLKSSQPQHASWVLSRTAVLFAMAATVLLGSVLLWQSGFFSPSLESTITSIPNGETTVNSENSSTPTAIATLSPLELMLQTKALKSAKRQHSVSEARELSIGDLLSQWLVQQNPQFQATVCSAAQRASESLDQALVFARRQNDFAMQLKLQRWVASRNRIESHIAQDLTAFSNTPVTDLEAWRLKLLCHAGSKHSFGAIMRIATIGKFQEYRFRDDFLVSVLRHAESQQLVQLAAPLEDFDHRNRVMAELFRRSDRDSLQGVFQLSQTWNSLQSVQHGARALPDLPKATIDNLFVVLSNSHRKSHRMIAAAALAESESPEISRRLIRMTRQPEHSRTAILALAGRTDLESKRFVKHIENDLQYATVVQSARRLWQRMPP